MRRAFISSTSKDLIPYRKAANETCISLGIHPVAMEFFPAMAAGAVEGSKKKIDESDFYIGIFGFRYGWIAPGETKSVTEIEFDYAASKGHDQLCFLAHPDLEADWPEKDDDPTYADKLKAFKDRINSSLIRAQFRDVSEFKYELIKALVDGGYGNKETPLTYATYRPDPFPPAGELPDPLHLPPDSRMTHSRNPSFVGREDDLMDIAKILLRGDGGAVGIVAAAAVGIGGLGKTQLAVEFCYRYGRFFQGVHWLQLPISPPFMVDRGTLFVNGDESLCRKAGGHGTAVSLRSRSDKGESPSQAISRRDSPMWLSAINNTEFSASISGFGKTVPLPTIYGGDVRRTEGDLPRLPAQIGNCSLRSGNGP